MKEYVLNYYSQFRCIAEECKHTCCAGWEMTIDESTLNKYRAESSVFSKALQKGIDYKRSKFKADKNGRCAFLNEKGLCEIIINLGEKKLCQVCRDHPRFRSFFNDRVEMGLGFCCEQSARIILSFKEKIEPLLIGDDDKVQELDFNQKNLIRFRDKALSIVQDRSLSINDRIEKLLAICKAKIDKKDFHKIVKKFLSLERLDKNWAKRLKSIDLKVFSFVAEEKLSIICEQFLVNCIYRHLSCAEDTMWVRANMIACVLSWWIIKSVIERESIDVEQNFEQIVDVVRAFSLDVEYSQKNLDSIFVFARQFIKI